MQVQSLKSEDPWKEKLATYSSILALKNSMDREAWQATVHVVANSWSDWACIHTSPKTVFNPSQRAAHGQWLMWKFNDLSHASVWDIKAILSPQALIGHRLSLQLQPPCGPAFLHTQPCLSQFFTVSYPNKPSAHNSPSQSVTVETQSKTLYDIQIFSMERVHGVLNDTLSVIFKIKFYL